MAKLKKKSKAEKASCPLGGRVEIAKGVAWCLTHERPVTECAREKMESDRECGVNKEA